MSEKCQYKNPQGKNICSEKIWEQSPLKFCLLHDPSFTKPGEALEALVLKKIDLKQTYFEGAIFNGPLNLREKIFEDFANFEHCQFLGKETSFYKCQFLKGALFNNSVFKGNRTNFARAQFEGDFALFNAVEFESFETHFYDTQFRAKHVSFAGLRSKSQELSFKKAYFSGSTFFNESQFNGDQLNFDDCKVEGNLFSFSKSKIGGKLASWNNSIINCQQIDWSETNFNSDEVLFKNLRWTSPEIIFHHSFFKNRSLSFLQAEFQFNLLNFCHTSFQVHEFDFSETKFLNGVADFSYAYFQSKFLKAYPLYLENQLLRFDRTEFSGDEKSIYFISSQKTQISFVGVFFHGGTTKLKGNLEAAFFSESSLDQVNFSEAIWEKKFSRAICMDELNAIQSAQKEDFQKAEEVCRKIKKCYENSGNYEISSDFYYGEMECKRKATPRAAQSGLQFMRLACGYGEKPIRVILTSWIVILLCAFLFLYGGVKTPDRIINQDFLSGFHNLKALSVDFFNCVYFSVVSFTTLGYGDYHPIGWSRIVGASEGFMGAFFMSMYVLTIGRKLNR
ncbi:MAG: hypothetical protein HQM15_03465 [Deltaproteobacteria bacterium]|nr:hypothetical protein [Deltaproteobacteria bacterium]